MPLIFTLAFRNLFHDRLRLVATVIGIVFSIVLVTVQMGLYLGFGRMVTTMIDHASADLWVMPQGTKCFEDPSLLDERQRFRALSMNGRRRRDPGRDRLCRMAHAERRRHAGVRRRLGPARQAGLPPWNLVEGRVESLAMPECGRGRPHLFRPARHFRARRDGRNPPAEGAGRGGHRRHPLVHHHALRVHGPRSGASLHRRFAEQGDLFPGPGRARGRRRSGASRPAGTPHRRRGPDPRRVPRPQPFVLAVRHRRRRRVVCRRPARRHRRHRDCRPDALFQHQGSPQRVRHPARDRIVEPLHLQGHHLRRRS